MTREKFPEKIPFRLTRMLTNAMEVSIPSDLEGTVPMATISQFLLYFFVVAKLYHSLRTRGVNISA